MDLVNHFIILGKDFLWSCRKKELNHPLTISKEFLKINETEIRIAFKYNRIAFSQSM